MHHFVTIVSALVLALSFGYLQGRNLATDSREIIVQPDNRAAVPVVEILGIRNGLLHGKISGNARVNIAGTVLVQSGVFVADAADLLRNEVWVRVPEDAKFVASKRGKKYYPVNASAGSRIAPINRMYFPTEQAAQAAGYVE